MNEQMENPGTAISAHLTILRNLRDRLREDKKVSLLTLNLPNLRAFFSESIRDIEAKY